MTILKVFWPIVLATSAVSAQAFNYDHPLAAAAVGYRSTQAKIHSGRPWFFDPRVSRIDCNHCHNPMRGGSDARPFRVAAAGIGGDGKHKRSKTEIQFYLEAKQPLLDRLYQSALRDNPHLQGKVVMRFTILPDGSVVECKIESIEWHDPDLESGLVTLFSTFNFGAMDVEATEFAFPLELLP